MTKNAFVLLVSLAGACATDHASNPDVRTSPRSSALTHAIDHIGIAAPDLDAAITLIADRTGVTPVHGGSHPGQGTHNALMSLGEGRYLELIAPVPGAAPAEGSEVFAKLTGPTPLFFTVRASDIASTRALLKEEGFKPTELQAGERERPDGVTLHWHTFEVSGPGLESAPFFIEWGADSAHPSTTSPAGCTLLELDVYDRDVSAVARLIKTLGLDVATHTREAAGLRVTLRCPKGEVTFGP